jgi:hypothetical protein
LFARLLEKTLTTAIIEYKGLELNKKLTSITKRFTDKDVKDLLTRVNISKSILRSVDAAEEDKKKIIQSPGKITGNHVFEQANEKLYYVYSLEKKGFAVPAHEDQVWSSFPTLEAVYVPLARLLWRPLPLPNLKFELFEIKELYREIRSFIYGHVDFANDVEYDLATAWVLHSWRMENFTVTPYLFFYGPAKSGKTRAMETLAALSFRPLLVALTSASLYNITEKWKPTIFLDETELYLKGNERADILNYLNMGYRRGQYAIRMMENAKTRKYEPTPYDVFGAKCLAGTKNLLTTLRSRCFPFVMSRASRSLKRSVNYEWADKIRAKLIMYRFLSLAANREPLPIPDDFLNEVRDGRLTELFHPLMVVAPESARIVLSEHASMLDKEAEREDELSVESFVFNALVNVRKNRQLIPLSEVKDAVNLNFQEKALGSKTVSLVLGRLGFKRFLVRNRVHVVWDDEIVERLSRRYPIRKLLEKENGDNDNLNVKDIL